MASFGAGLGDLRYHMSLLCYILVRTHIIRAPPHTMQSFTIVSDLLCRRFLSLISLFLFGAVSRPQVTEAKLIALRAHADHIGSDHIALTKLVAETRAMLGLGGAGGGMANKKKTKVRRSERYRRK
jgi:hypothetical protein